MSTELTTILVAIIAAVAPTLAVLWSRSGTRAQLVEIHAVVNSRLEAALKKISVLEEDIRELKWGNKAPPTRPKDD